MVASLYSGADKVDSLYVAITVALPNLARDYEIVFVDDGIKKPSSNCHHPPDGVSPAQV